MSETKEYKCPNCAATVVFDSTTQMMKCPYCDSEFDVVELQHFDEELNNPAPDNLEWDKTDEEWNDTEGMVVYLCESCGGEIIGQETMGASNCPYCGNPVVIMDAFRGALKPNYVIPFKFDKKEAKEKLKKHYSGKFFLPKVFKDENHIDEIKALYVPFWIYDVNTHARMIFKGTKVRTWTSGKYVYTETSYYRINREGDLKFEKVPVDGSSSMPNELMESIEPFDFSEAVDFQTAYLSGYLADKYDDDVDKCTPIANKRIQNSTETEFRRSVHGYGSLVTESKSIDFSDSKASYAMYPVYILNTSWRGKNYLFAINGQTGKTVGNLPLDVAKVFLWAVILFVVFFILIFVSTAVIALL